MAGLTFVSAEHSIRLAYKVTLYWLIACCVGVVCWALAPLLLRSHTLPLRCWYPFDALVCIANGGHYVSDIVMLRLSEARRLRSRLRHPAVVSDFNGLYFWQRFSPFRVGGFNYAGSV